jgi:hypothetical protein
MKDVKINRGTWLYVVVQGILIGLTGIIPSAISQAVAVELCGGVFLSCDRGVALAGFCAPVEGV